MLARFDSELRWQNTGTYPSASQLTLAARLDDLVAVWQFCTIIRHVAQRCCIKPSHPILTDRRAQSQLLSELGLQSVFEFLCEFGVPFAP
jgi:hypothetical protein